MSLFEDRMARAQAAIYCVLGRGGFVHPKAGGEPIAVQVIVRTPTVTHGLDAAAFVHTGPYARIPVSQLPAFKKGDVVVRAATPTLPADAWVVQEAPQRPAPGHYWEAQVSPADVPEPAIP